MTGLTAPTAVDEPSTLIVDTADGMIRLQAHHIVVSIGREASLPRLPVNTTLDEHGHPVVDAIGRTTTPGLYIAGDARRGLSRQIAIASGDGLATAMDAVSYLRRIERKCRE